MGRFNIDFKIQTRNFKIMKQIMLWIIFVSLTVADTNTAEEKVREYEFKSMYHLSLKEYALALEYAKQGCKLGSSEACSNVASMYVNGIIDDKVYYFKAHQYYKKACILKNAYACTAAGIVYEEGLGLNKGYIDQAKPYFAEGCLLGNGRGCNYLGVIEYKAGNDKKAIELYLKSCSASCGLDCYNYAYALDRGQGVKVDFKKAVSYYMKGCKLNVGVSCTSAADMIYGGDGIEEDKVLAKEYFEKACSLKHEPSCELVKELF